MKQISWIVLIGSFLLFQVHSAFAWNEITGNLTGVLWSIMFELSAIYFWSNGDIKLGVVASIVVLLMASFNITKEARINLATIEAKQSSEKAVNVLVNTLDSIKDKSYPMTIQKTINAITVMADNNTTQKPKSESSQWLGIVLQLIALCFVLVAQIKAILFIRGDVLETVKTDAKTSSDSVDKQDKNTITHSSKVLLAKEVIKLVDELNKQRGDLSINKTMMFLGVDDRFVHTNIKKIAKGESASISEDKIRVVKNLILEKG